MNESQILILICGCSFISFLISWFFASGWRKGVERLENQHRGLMRAVAERDEIIHELRGELQNALQRHLASLPPAKPPLISLDGKIYYDLGEGRYLGYDITQRMISYESLKNKTLTDIR